MTLKLRSSWLTLLLPITIIVVFVGIHIFSAVQEYRTAALMAANAPEPGHLHTILMSVMSDLAAAALLCGLTLLLHHRAMGQLVQLQKAAAQLQAGTLPQPLPSQGLIELDAIAQALNQLRDQSMRQDIALQVAQASLERQAHSAEMINDILTSAEAVNQQEFTQVALDKILLALGGEAGTLNIHPLTASRVLVSAAPPPDSGLRAAIPLPGQADGLISISARPPKVWTEADQSLLNLLAHQIGTAMERREANARSIEASRRMTRLISFSEQLNQHLNQTELLAVIGEGAMALASVSRAVILLVGPYRQLSPAWYCGVSQPFAQGLASSQPLPIFTNPMDPHPTQYRSLDQLASKSPEWWAEHSAGIQSACLVPLLYEGHLNALIACFYDLPDLPGFCHPDMLETFARQAATSLENTRLIEAERQQRILAEALRDVTAALTSTLDADEVFERILVNLGKVIQHDAASIMMVEGDRLHVIRGHGYPTANGASVERSIPLNLFPHVVKMCQSGEIALIPSTYENPEWVVTPETAWIQAYAGAPVRARGQVIGVINLIGREAGIFHPEQKNIIQGFADQSAIAIENARIHQNTRRQMAESTTLYHALTNLLTPGGTVKEISERIVSTVTDELRVGNCSYLTVDRGANLLRLTKQAGSEVLTIGNLKINGGGLVAAAFARNEIIYAPDVRLDIHYLQGSANTRSELVIPLRANGTIFALLNMEHPNLDAFDASTRQTLASFAERAALVLENARLLENARSQAEVSERLRKATAALTTYLNFDEVAQRISTHLGELVRFDSLAVFLVQDGSLSATILNNQKGNRLERPLDDPIFLEMNRRRKPVLLNETQKDPRFIHLASAIACRTWAEVPLFAGNDVIGSIGIGRSASEPFLDDEILLAQVFSNQAGAAMQNALLHAREQQLAITDPLTGMYNRRGFIELARHELERSSRFGRPLALLMIDIDHFKKVNDTYGHPAGDEVLRELGRRMRHTLRAVDLVCRYGGEEFCVILPESTLEGAQTTAERLRQLVYAEAFSVRAFSIPVSISIGLACLTNLNQTLDDLVDAADRALLRSKAEGRNRTSLA